MINMDYTFEHRTVESLEEDAQELYAFLGSILVIPLFVFQSYVIQKSQSFPEILEDITSHHSIL